VFHTEGGCFVDNSVRMIVNGDQFPVAVQSRIADGRPLVRATVRVAVAPQSSPGTGLLYGALCMDRILDERLRPD